MPEVAGQATRAAAVGANAPGRHGRRLLMFHGELGICLTMVGLVPVVRHRDLISADWHVDLYSAGHHRPMRR